MSPWTNLWESPRFGGHVEGEAFLPPIGEITDRNVDVRAPLDPALVSILLDPAEWQGPVSVQDELGDFQV